MLRNDFAAMINHFKQLKSAIELKNTRYLGFKSVKETGLSRIWKILFFFTGRQFVIEILK